MLRVYVWGPQWGLTSVDPACLTVITYLQIMGQEEWGIVECNNPNISPTGELPILKDETEWITGVDHIISHLKKKGLDADENLTTRQKADSLAYTSFVNESIYDLLLFEWYVNSKNFVEAIRPLYARLLSFPIRYFIPTQLRDSAKERLARHGVVSVGDTGLLMDKEQKMSKVAKKSYNVLSKKISDNEFFFGDQPSTLDVIVYSHLALHLYAELPNRELAKIIDAEHPRLASFCDRIKVRLSSKSINILPAELPSVFSGLLHTPRIWFTNAFRTSNDAEMEERSEVQAKFERERNISIFGAIVFMITYIYWNGLISIEYGDPENDDEHEEEQEIDTEEAEYDEDDED